MYLLTSCHRLLTSKQQNSPSTFSVFLFFLYPSTGEERKKKQAAMTLQTQYLSGSDRSLEVCHTHIVDVS